MASAAADGGLADRRTPAGLWPYGHAQDGALDIMEVCESSGYLGCLAAIVGVSTSGDVAAHIADGSGGRYVKAKEAAIEFDRAHPERSSGIDAASGRWGINLDGEVVYVEGSAVLVRVRPQLNAIYAPGTGLLARRMAHGRGGDCAGTASRLPHAPLNALCGLMARAGGVKVS